MTEETKVCSKCGENKKLAEFSLDRNKLRSECKKCVSERNLRKYHENIELSRERCRKNYRNNVEKKKTWAKNYRKDNPEKIMLEQARSRSKRNNIQFDITIEDIVIPEVCPVLGIPIIRSDGNPTDNSPSIDKIIPERGYVKGNVMVISYRANRLKSDASVEEIEKILNYIRGLTKPKTALQ